MYFKHKLHMYIFCVFMSAQSLHAKSFAEIVKDLLSFKLPPDLFASVNESIVGKVRAKNIKFIVPNKIEMDDVEVLDELGERVLYGKHVKLTISLLSLLTNNIKITESEVHDPFFRYTIKGGIHNVIRVFEDPPQLATAGSKPKPPSKLRVTIEKVVVENGSYQMTHDAGVTIHASGIRAGGNFWVEDGPFGVDISQVNIERGSIVAAGMTLPITNVVARKLWISDQKVSTEDLVARYEKALLRGKGTVFIDDDRYDVTASLDAPTNTYPQGLAPLPMVPPAFTAAVKMSGSLTEPQILADIDLGSTNFNGLIINNGKMVTQINQHMIQVASAKLSVGKNGQISASGAVDIDKGSFSFVSQEKNIYAQELVDFLSAKKIAHGVIDAESQYSGSFLHKDKDLRIVSKGAIAGGVFENINFARTTNFSFDASYVFDKKITIARAQVKDNLGLSVTFNGTGDLISNSLRGDFVGRCGHVSKYVKLKADTDEIKGLSAQGKVSYAAGNLGLKISAKAQHAQLYNLAGSDISASLDFTNNQLTADIKAKFYTGSLEADILVGDFYGQQSLSGTAVIERANLAPLSRGFSDVLVGGSLTSFIGMNGTLRNPIVMFSADIDDPHIDKAIFNSAEVVGQWDDGVLAISKLLVHGKAGFFSGDNVALDFNNKTIAGALTVSNLDLASSFANYVPAMSGSVSGPVQLSGTFAKPIILAPLLGKNISAYGVELGSGALTLGLGRSALLHQSRREDLIFSVSATLNQKSVVNSVRFSLALHEKSINLDAVINGLDLNTADLGLLERVGIAAHIQGTILAHGSISSPTIEADIIATEYGFFDPSLRSDAIAIKKTHGPALITAQSSQGKLELNLCASLLLPSESTMCDPKSGLQFSVRGPFSLDEFKLDIEGSIKHNHLEDMLFVLKNELIALDAEAQVSGTITKKRLSPITYQGSVVVNHFATSLPNIPHILLKDKVKILVNNDQFKLVDDAVLEFSPGQLTIKGLYSPLLFDVSFQGSIPLVLSRFFMPFIQGADGLAHGSLMLSGSPQNLMLDGRITPEPRSSFSLRKWVEPIEVREGSISFQKTSSHSFSTNFEKIKLAVGDGRLFIDGGFSAGSNNDSSLLNVNVVGSNIVFRDRLNFVETDFNIVTQPGDQGELVVGGNIIITDGSAHRQFNLRNFVAEARSSFNPATFKFMNDVDVKTDLDITVRQFKASARMLNLDIESILRGQISLKGSLAKPKFSGALFVTEGAIIFPALSFDLVESQIVLDEHSPRVFDPKINIVASQELDKETFQQLTQDTTIELSLRGDLDKLSLELRPVRGDLRLNQLKIFMLLLSPQTITGFEDQGRDESLRRGAQNAAMALSEVFLRPLTNELQDLLEGKTKTRIQLGSAIEPAGVTLSLNWKLGPRIELQGSYMFVNWDTLRGGEKAIFMADNTPLGDLKLKLLLFDHRPLGPLFLETSFGSVRYDDTYEPRGKVRLKYRVLSK